MPLVTPDPQVSRNWGAASTSALGLRAQRWGQRRRWPQVLRSALWHPVIACLFWEASLDSFVVGALCSQKRPGMIWEGLHLFTPHLFFCPEQSKKKPLLGNGSVAPIGRLPFFITVNFFFSHNKIDIQLTILTICGDYCLEGVCHVLKVLVAQLCPSLWDSLDCFLPDFSVHEILQARYWSRLPFPPPGDLANSGIKSRSPAL